MASDNEKMDALVLKYVTEHPGSGLKEISSNTQACVSTTGIADPYGAKSSQALQRLKGAGKVFLKAMKWYPRDRSQWPLWAVKAEEAGWTPPKGWKP